MMREGEHTQSWQVLLNVKSALSTLKIPPSCEEVNLLWRIHLVVSSDTSLSWPATRWRMNLPVLIDQFFIFISYQSPWNFTELQRHAKNLLRGEMSARERTPQLFYKQENEGLEKLRIVWAQCGYHGKPRGKQFAILLWGKQVAG